MAGHGECQWGGAVWEGRDGWGAVREEPKGNCRRPVPSRKLAPNEVCGEVAKLKPADPLATEEGRFAHSIKIPNPVPEDSGYKPGMTSQEYFDHLCKTEAGEFIYKTVENVEGIYMMRPRKEASDSMHSSIFMRWKIRMATWM